MVEVSENVSKVRKIKDPTMSSLSGEEYDYDQWDEDKVDLSFKTVSDLQSLLTARDLQLDYQLFKQSAKIHALLRKVIKTQKTL